MGLLELGAFHADAVLEALDLALPRAQVALVVARPEVYLLLIRGQEVVVLPEALALPDLARPRPQLLLQAARQRRPVLARDLELQVGNHSLLL